MTTKRDFDQILRCSNFGEFDKAISLLVNIVELQNKQIEVLQNEVKRRNDYDNDNTKNTHKNY